MNLRPSSFKKTISVVEKPKIKEYLTQKFPLIKLDRRAILTVPLKMTVKNKLMEKEQLMIENNILKINKENINKTFVKVSKANNMGRMLNPKINFKAMADQDEDIHIKMYLGGSFFKEFNVREFEAEFYK